MKACHSSVISRYAQAYAPSLVGSNLSAPAAAKRLSGPAPIPPLHLTPRQREVLVLLCDGLPNKLISRQLGISAATVKVHIGCILRELGVSSRLQAVVAARRLELVSEIEAARPLTSDAFGGSGPRDQSRMLQILWDELSARRLTSGTDSRMAAALG